MAPIKLDGDFDMANCKELWKTLQASAGKDVAVLDFATVTYVDTSALASLVRLRKHMKAQGGEGIVRIVNANSMILRILRICALDTVFEIHGCRARDVPVESNASVRIPFCEAPRKQSI